MGKPAKSGEAAPQPTLIFHRPCAFNPNGVSKDTCAATTAVVMRNRDGCCRIKCTSPARLCIACFNTGAQTPSVVDPKHFATGLCAWHAENGATAKQGDWKSYEGRPSLNLRPAAVNTNHNAEAVVPRSMQKEPAKAETFAVPPPKPVPVAPLQVPKVQVAPKAAPVKPAVPKVVAPKPAAPKILQGEILPPLKEEEVKDEAWKDMLARARKAIAEGKEMDLDPSLIGPMPNQPRKYFDPEGIHSLAESMGLFGQLVRGFTRPATAGSGYVYELIDGERRWRATKEAGIKFRTIHIDIDDEAVAFVVAAVANFNRADHTPIEISDSVHRMLGLKIPMPEVAKLLGISVPWAYSMHGLQKLHVNVRDMMDPNLVRDKKRLLPLTAAMDISKLPQEAQQELAERVLAKKVSLPGLRDEVLRVARDKNLPVRTRSVNSSVRWKSIEGQTIGVQRNANLIMTRITSIPQQELAAAHSGRRQAAIAHLTVAIDDLNKCIERLRA